MNIKHEMRQVLSEIATDVESYRAQITAERTGKFLGLRVQTPHRWHPDDPDEPTEGVIKAVVDGILKIRVIDRRDGSNVIIDRDPGNVKLLD